MENLINIEKEHPQSRRPLPLFSESGNLSVPQSEVLSEDLASFLVAHYILVAKNESVSSVREHFSATHDLSQVVDHVLLKLEEAGLIQVAGNKIERLSEMFDLGGNSKNLLRFLPRLFSLATERVLLDSLDSSLARKKEALRYFVIPNSAEIANEAKALQLEFSAKMYKLLEKVKLEKKQADGIQLVGVFQAELVSEDFA